MQAYKAISHWQAQVLSHCACRAKANVKTSKGTLAALTVVHIPIKDEHTLRASCLRSPARQWVTNGHLAYLRRHFCNTYRCTSYIRSD